MSEQTDEIRALLDKANVNRDTDASIGFLIQAMQSLCDQLDAHQHSYFAPKGLVGQWVNTQPERAVETASHRAYMKQMADKKKKAGTDGVR